MERAKPALSHSTVSGNEPRRTNPLAWWYRLTAPSEPPANANFTEREAARRGRLASTILLVMIVHVLIAIPVGIMTSDLPLLTTLIVTLVIDVIALSFNRQGKRLVAGLLVMVAFQLGFMVALLTTPGGLAVGNLPTFDLMVEAVLVAVAFFSDRSIFFAAAVNCLLILASLTFGPHAADLVHYQAVDGYDVFIRPILLEVVVAVLTYLWAHSAIQAIVLANRNEETALFQRAVAQQEHAIAEHQKQLLDSTIKQIVEATGSVTGSVSITSLLEHLQCLTHDSQELQRTRETVAFLVTALRQARQEQQPLRVDLRATSLDPLIMELVAFQKPLPEERENRRQEGEPPACFS